MKEIKRDFYLDELISKKNNGLIKVITGIRRCGKSYLLFNLFYRYLISLGIEEKRIIRFSFDVDEDIDKLDGFFPNDGTKIKEPGKNSFKVNSKKFRAYLKALTQEGGQFYILLDEIQNLDGFVGTLNGLLRNENFDVYVTGSNSRFLSSDILTEFRGRGDQVHVYPLSFKEFYDYRGLGFAEAYKEYSYYGGMPLVLNYENEQRKAEYLKNLYQEVYLKDLVERNGILDPENLDRLVKILSSSIGSYTNAAKLEGTFKSDLHLSYNHSTIEKHIGYLVDSFLISKATRYDIKGKGYIQARYKYYFTDIGLRNAVLNFRQIEPTHIMENIIYNELVAGGYNVDIGIVEISELNSEKASVRKQLEVDFVVNQGDERIYIQSVYAMPTLEKAAQEKRSLLRIADSFKKVIIVNENIHAYKTDEGIQILSLEDFLLNKTKLL